MEVPSMRDYQEFYREESLGTFKARILKRNARLDDELGLVELDLKLLYEHTTRMKIPVENPVNQESSLGYRGCMLEPSYEEMTRPDNIETIVLFGSTLYRNVPRTRAMMKKKWGLFGPLIEKDVVVPQRMPRDIDILVIVKEGIDDEKIIRPKRTQEFVDDCYGGHYSQKIVGPVHAHQIVKEYGGMYETRDLNSSLHITYRTVKQITNGCGAGDTVSESVVGHGVPLVGAPQFSEIIKDIPSITRNPLHTIAWKKIHQRYDAFLK